MKKDYYIKTCELFHSSNYFPICFFDNDHKILKCFSSFKEFDLFFLNIIQQKLIIKSNPHLLEGHLGLYGLIKIKKTSDIIIIGPFINKPFSNQTIEEIMLNIGISQNKKDELKNYLNSIQTITYNQFLNFISFMHFIINKEEISTIKHFNMDNSKYTKEIAEKNIDDFLSEEDIVHGTYLFEQQLLTYVKNGDVEGLNVFLKHVEKNMKFTEGKLADNELRQQKNLCIGLICMVGKVGAIKGNLDIEHTYKLIDLYTQQFEKCQTINEVYILRYNAIVDFTKQVAEKKLPPFLSKEIYFALQFIKRNTNKNLSIMDVVNQSKKSRSVFLKEFKKETGKTINEFIVETKLQEAKQLLTFSDRSLSEISNFLCFSSQSYFNNKFKKEYGITPMQYRKKYSTIDDD